MQTGEGQPLIRASTWTLPDARLLASCFAVTVGIVMGTYYPVSLLARLEADHRLGWEPWDSAAALTIGASMEALGLLLGGFADKYSCTAILGSNAAVVMAGMLLFSESASVRLVIANVAIVTFFKGLMWPSLGALIAANMESSKLDVSFLLLAIASRLGDAVGALTLGELARQNFSWRESVLALLAVVSVFFLIAHLLIQQVRVASKANSGIVLDSGKFVSFVRCPDSWLATLQYASTNLVWSLTAYITLILHDVYGATPGEATGLAVFGHLGMVTGLATACFLSYLFSIWTGRAMHLVQIAVSCGALAMLAKPHTLTLHLAVVCYFFTGFGSAAGCYLPHLLFSANSSAQERAFRVGLVECIGSVVCTIGTWQFGALRAKLGTMAAVPEIHSIAAAAAVVTFVSTAAMYSRFDGRCRATRTF